MQLAQRAVRVVAAVGGEVAEQFVRGAEAHQFAHVARVFPQEAHGGADAAGLCVAQERLEAGNAGDADVYRQGDLPRLQVFQPGGYRRHLEAELGDEGVVAGVGERVALFLCFRRFLVGAGDVRRAFGVAGKADVGEAVVL